MVHSPAAIAASTISQIQIDGIVATEKETILNLLPFKEGEAFDQKKLDEGVQTLKTWGIFDKIETKTSSTPGGIVVAIRLHEGLIISTIRLTGHYPYLAAKIRKRLDLQVGDIVTEEKIAEQKSRIERFYEKEGFYDTRVDVETKPSARENNVGLIFHIRKGSKTRVGQVFFEGNKSVSTGRLYSFIKPMDVYSEKNLKSAINEIISFYRDKGFLQAKAKVKGQTVDPKKRRAFLTIGIVEGPRVKVFFRGKRIYRHHTLKETITLFKEGNFDKIEISASAKALRDKMKQDGFTRPKVATKREKINPDLFHITFTLSPGKQTFIKKIGFEGNRTLSDKELKKNLFNKEHGLTQKGVLSEPDLQEDKKMLEEYYQSKGFPDAAVALPVVSLNQNKTRTTIQYPVEEGIFVKVRTIQFEGADDFSKKGILKFLKNKEGEAFNQTALPYDKEQVLLFFKNHGYPYAEVDQEIKAAEPAMPEKGAVEIFYTVRRGAFVVFGETLFVGDILTGIKPLQETLSIKKGEFYSAEKIIQGELNLRRLGTFNAVRVAPVGLEDKKTVIPLVVNVEERPPFVMDVETRFTTDQQYSGTLQFTNYNSFGWAKQSRLSLIGGLKKDRAELSWLDPRFLDSDVSMTLASWIDYEKRAIDRSAQTAGAISFFRQFHRFGFLGRYQIARTYLISGQSTDPNSLRDSTLSQIGLSSSYDKRDSFSDPTRGFFALAGSTIFNEIRGARADFVKLKGAFSEYLSPFSRFTFATTLRLDRIQSLIKSASIPQQEFLSLGGDDTLRGFKEDRAGPLNAGGAPLGGRTRLIFNEELGFRLSPSFQWALFYDGGTLTDDFDDIDLQTYRHSFGSGLRYVTPIGPIRADYGIILDRQPNENFGRFHLTFGYFF